MRAVQLHTLRTDRFTRSPRARKGDSEPRTWRRTASCATLFVAATLNLAIAPASAAAASKSSSLAAGKRAALNEQSVRRIFGPRLRKLGLRISRVHVGDGRDYSTLRGQHLAVYTEPLSEGYRPSDYVRNIVPSAKVFLPKVFRRWRHLGSFDLCQESLDDPSSEPPPETSLLLSRQGSLYVRWSRLQLRGLLEATDHFRSQSAPGKTPDVQLYLRMRLRQDPLYVQAEALAEGRISA
jgi:hypothetical protein